MGVASRASNNVVLHTVGNKANQWVLCTPHNQRDKCLHSSLVKRWKQVTTQKKTTNDIFVKGCHELLIDTRRVPRAREGRESLLPININHHSCRGSIACSAKNSYSIKGSVFGICNHPSICGTNLGRLPYGVTIRHIQRPLASEAGRPFTSHILFNFKISRSFHHISKVTKIECKNLAHWKKKVL